MNRRALRDRKALPKAFVEDSSEEASQNTDEDKLQAKRKILKKDLHSSTSEQDYESSEDEVSETFNKSQNISGSSIIHQGDKTLPDIYETFDSSRSSQNTSDRKTPTKNKVETINKDVKTDHAQSYMMKVAILAVLACIIWVLVLPNWKKPESEIPPEEMFRHQMMELKGRTSQDEKLWRIINGTMRKHIAEQDPKQPHVLMFVSTEKAAKTREVLARKVAEVYSERCDEKPVFLSGGDYMNIEHATAKEKIDEKITEAFKLKSCAAVVSNFQLLPPASTTTFYQFCENDYAPFKNVSVIFTLEIAHGSWDSENRYPMLKDEEVPRSKSWDGIVDLFLNYVLSSRDKSRTMDTDMISGLMTRITPSVVWVAADDAFADN